MRIHAHPAKIHQSSAANFNRPIRRAWNRRIIDIRDSIGTMVDTMTRATETTGVTLMDIAASMAGAVEEKKEGQGDNMWPNEGIKE